jgi:hypothetical protein
MDFSHCQVIPNRRPKEIPGDRPAIIGQWSFPQFVEHAGRIGRSGRKGALRSNAVVDENNSRFTARAKWLDHGHDLDAWCTAIDASFMELSDGAEFL